MTEFRVTRDGSTVEDAVFDVDPVVDTANPFGDYCVIKLDDRGGNKFDKYQRGTRVDVEIIDESGTTFDRFTGYVVERRENEQAGADALEVEVYSFDQFLRRNTVTNDQQGSTISQALADIIQTDTPVTYDPANIDIGDDQKLTRSYQGEAVENALRDFAFKSNNEEFGVNDDLEFFFRPRETEHIDRGIDNTEWFRYDIPELGKEAINEVEVWFNGGEESVIVDDGTDKLDLQDNLGLPSPGTQRAELNRPAITDIVDAEDIGRKYLNFRNSTLSGTVTTFELYDAEPGDTIDITIDSRGIDSEFVIAAAEYRWGVDETTLTVIERRGDVDDILTDLNDSVQRVEMEGANRDAPSNRITTTNATALVDVSVDADGNTPDAVRFVNDGRRAVRDGWRGAGLPDVSALVVGDDGTGLSRSNDTLRNQTTSASVTQTLPDATSVEFSASITQTGVQELGLETADGRLITRAVFASPVDLNGTVTVTLGVSNDASVSRGVLTNDGQKAVRDVLANNSPPLPDAYAYGSDGSAVSESDSALGNKVIEVSLDDVLLQDANVNSEWEGLIPDAFDSRALTVTGDELTTQQSNFVFEGENPNEFRNTISDGDFSGGEAIQFTVTNETFTWTITPEYDIESENVGIAVRDRIVDSGTDVSGVSWRLNGEQLDSVTGVEKPLGWSDFTNGGAYTTGTFDGYTGETLQAGEEYDLSVTIAAAADANEDYHVDVVSVYDTRYTYTFDNTNDGSGGFLDGPELFPDQIIQSFTTATTRRDVTEAQFELTANDTSNNFYVELANDGGTFTRVSNADSGSVVFAAPNTDVDTNISLGRFGSRTTATPQTGFQGQAVSAWQLFANPSAVVPDNIQVTNTRGVISPNTITGKTIREAGLKNDASDTLLTRHELAEFTVESGQRIASAETTQFTGGN